LALPYPALSCRSGQCPENAGTSRPSAEG
jgi:hypothetical protein